MIRPALPLAALAALSFAGCTQLPPIDRTADAQAQAAPYPDLVPTAWLTDDLPAPRLTESDAAALDARGDALRRKAAALR